MKRNSKSLIAAIILITLTQKITTADEVLADNQCVNCDTKSCLTGPKCARCKPNHGLKSGSVKECEECKAAERKRSNEVSNKCEECPDRFILSGVECKECGIREIRVNNECKPCEDHKIQKSNKCEDCKLNEISTDMNECKACETGYKQEGNKCVKCQEHFYSISATNECKECKDNEIVENNACKACGATEGRVGDKCVPCTSRQIKYDKGKCVDCKDREKVDKTANKCIECPKHQIRVENECKECKLDEISDGNVCKQVGGNQIQVDNKAVDCKDNQFVKDNKCVDCGKNCQKCVPPDGNCQLCLLGEFGLDPAGAKDCKTCSDPKCLNCGKDHKKCEECQTGSFLSPTGCKECIKDCHLCTTEKNCFKCGNGKFVKGGICVDSANFTQEKIKCADDCVRCTTYLQCDQCRSGFFVNNDKLCQQCPGNCSECTSSDVCSLCQAGYTADNSGVCHVTSDLENNWPWWKVLLIILAGLSIIGLIGYLIFQRKQDEFRSSNMLDNQTSYPYKKVEDSYGRGQSYNESDIYRSRDSLGRDLELSRNIGF